MRIGVIQLNNGDDPVVNLSFTQIFIADAVAQGATFVATPEVTNMVSTSQVYQNSVLRYERDDQTLKSLRAMAADLNIWLLIGSLTLKTNNPDGRLSNRSFLINSKGEITATYDKVHLFDVEISQTESYCESAVYRSGMTVPVAATPTANIGMSICYDLRFPNLYRDLAQHGAHILTVPSAFSPVTGGAHWNSLLRARAIENGCFVIAPAQTGEHAISAGKPRSTYGHSLVVNPWGEVLLDAGTATGAHVVDLDLASVQIARDRIPALQHDRIYAKP